MRRNHFITTASKKKVAILDCFIDIACFLIIFTLVTSETLNLDSMGKLGDGDPREEIALVLAAGAAVVRLVLTVAVFTTAPGWAPVAAVVGAGLLFVSICIVAWDYFDGNDTGKFNFD